MCNYLLKVAEEEFIDDYERPVLEKYERITPTPTEKKKVHISIHFTHTAQIIMEFIDQYDVSKK